MVKYTELLTRLTDLTVATSPPVGLPERLCRASQEILGADGAALTVRNTTASRATVCTTDKVIARLANLQEVTGQGPCREAFQHGTYFTVDLDDRFDPRWPEFSRAARRAVGPATMYSFPIHPDGETFAVISLYTVPDKDLAESTGDAQFLFDAAGKALLGDAAAHARLELAGAWSSHAEVHQACGMVVAQLHVAPDDALAILRAHAYARTITLADTARRVIDRELDFRPRPFNR
ncbi:ANTAR domain-containing protein [Kribbella deserti]|uniref:ANTAR domain-containing protein n=1 Tax=Kribbella deserti TaxID=1926257 RepID=A0ABV6QH07_9ACTN